MKHLGLQVSSEKTAALVYHPTPRNAGQTPPLLIGDAPLPWQKEAKYLGIIIQHRISWLPLVQKLRGQLIALQRAIRCLAARGRGCSQEWALRVYDAAGVSHILYALTLATPSKTNWAKVVTIITVIVMTITSSLLALPCSRCMQLFLRQQSARHVEIWGRRFVFLLSLVEVFPVLWDPGNADYNKTSIKNGIWKQIADEMALRHPEFAPYTVGE